MLWPWPIVIFSSWKPETLNPWFHLAFSWLDWIGLDWIGLDWIGLDWIEMVECIWVESSCFCWNVQLIFAVWLGVVMVHISMFFRAILSLSVSNFLSSTSSHHCDRIEWLNNFFISCRVIRHNYKIQYNFSMHERWDAIHQKSTIYLEVEREAEQESFLFESSTWQCSSTESSFYPIHNEQATKFSQLIRQFTTPSLPIPSHLFPNLFQLRRKNPHRPDWIEHAQNAEHCPHYVSYPDHVRIINFCCLLYKYSKSSSYHTPHSSKVRSPFSSLPTCHDINQYHHALSHHMWMFCTIQKQLDSSRFKFAILTELPFHNKSPQKYNSQSQSTVMSQSVQSPSRTNSTTQFKPLISEKRVFLLKKHQLPLFVFHFLFYVVEMFSSTSYAYSQSTISYSQILSSSLWTATWNDHSYWHQQSNITELKSNPIQSNPIHAVHKTTHLQIPSNSIIAHCSTEFHLWHEWQ